MPDTDKDGWTEWRALVLRKLDAHREDLRDLRKDLAICRTDIAGLKIKSGVWGAMAGLIPVVAALLWFALR